MNPFLNRVVPILIKGAKVGGPLAVVAGVGYGADQHTKRKQEQEASRARLREIEERLASNEAELESLRSILGVKNDQVRILAAEIEMLRQEAAALGGAA